MISKVIATNFLPKLYHPGAHEGLTRLARSPTLTEDYPATIPGRSFNKSPTRSSPNLKKTHRQRSAGPVHAPGSKTTTPVAVKVQQPPEIEGDRAGGDLKTLRRIFSIMNLISSELWGRSQDPMQRGRATIVTGRASVRRSQKFVETSREHFPAVKKPAADFLFLFKTCGGIQHLNGFSPSNSWKGLGDLLISDRASPRPWHRAPTMKWPQRSPECRYRCAGEIFIDAGLITPIPIREIFWFNLASSKGTFENSRSSISIGLRARRPPSPIRCAQGHSPTHRRNSSTGMATG